MAADQQKDTPGPAEGKLPVTDLAEELEKARKAEWLAQCHYEASQKAELRYKAFLNFLPDPVFVFNMDGTVSYLNPAFEKVFGWTLAELEGKIIPFIPDELKEETRTGFERMIREKSVHKHHTRRLTKDGRILDIILDGAIFYDEDGQPAGQVLTLRDITREKRIEKANQALFRIAKALYQHRQLDQRLRFIAAEVQNLLDVEGAFVILHDAKKREFFFRVVALDDSETGKKMQEIRFPDNKGVAGEVYRTGLPLIVNDTSKSPHYFKQVDTQAGYQTRSMLDVPILIDDRMIGVLCAVNKKNGDFDSEDTELLSTVAGIVALPVENARIHDELNRSYEDVKSLNRAKDRVIHHLSHELKTPVSVMSAALGLMKKKLGAPPRPDLLRLIERAERNLNRILDMQYEIEDMLRERDYRTYHVLTVLLEACKDELEMLIMQNLDEKGIVSKIRRELDTLFGPKAAPCETVRIDRFVQDHLERLTERFSHRQLLLETDFSPCPPVRIPPEVLQKIIEGLVRNAVENTPDGGRIAVTVQADTDGARLEVKDHGIGITKENQRLIFENYFTSYDPLQYASKHPYDFNAGGKGFDLLRMKIFSERFGFSLDMKSRRCHALMEKDQICPGKVDLCAYCKNPGDCALTGGTTMTVKFSANDPESECNR